LVATPGDGTVLSQGAYAPVSMNGREVYKFATREVPKVLMESLDAAGMTVEDIDWLLLHQVRS
jgi:3-oxoacyl-[acyl-carrier-protein] synthase III